jgi:outer membrane biosynthesis protein TonB
MQRGSLIFSAIFHAAILAFVVFGLPQLFEHKPLEDTPIAVQLVTMAAETRATHVTKTPPRPDAKPEPQLAQATPEPPKPEPPKPEPPKQAPPPPPPPKPPEPQPEPKPEPKPAPPEPPKEAIPPEPKPETKVEPKPEPPKPEPPKPVVEVPRPKEKPEPPKQVAKTESKETQKQQESDFSSLLKNLTKQKTAPSPQDATPKGKAQPAQQQASSQPIAPLGAQLTVSEKDLIIQQIEECWNVPAGAKDAQNLIVDIHIDVAADRTVTNVRIVDQSRYASDAFFRAAADSAKRALLNPRCSPLKLPADKFDQWKSITLSFNPKDVT